MIRADFVKIVILSYSLMAPTPKLCGYSSMSRDMPEIQYVVNLERRATGRNYSRDLYFLLKVIKMDILIARIGLQFLTH